MTRDELKEAYANEKISKQQLGQLRRMELNDLLDSLVSNPNLATPYINKNGNKLVLKKLAEKVGYDMEAVNISQSFKELVEKAEASLVISSTISTDTNAVLRKQNIDELKGWLDLRINNANYQWPVNNRNKIYRRVLWAFYLDTPPSEIDKPGGIMNTKEIQNILSILDVKVVRGELKTLDYAAISALEEMSDTMQSKAISKLTAETKELREKLTMANEEVRNLRHKLKIYRARDDALLHEDIKGSSIY